MKRSLIIVVALIVLAVIVTSAVQAHYKNSETDGAITDITENNPPLTPPVNTHPVTKGDQVQNPVACTNSIPPHCK
jgi:hypothetical protein